MRKETKDMREGMLCETAKKIEYLASGCLTATTGRGSDFIAICPGKKPTLIEVKKGCGSLSRLQRETRNKAAANGFDYKVERCGCPRRKNKH
jgi:hypothetical protein